MPSYTEGALEKKLPVEPIVGEYVSRESWIHSLPCFVFVSVKERKCLRYEVSYLLCYHEAAKCLGKIYFMVKVNLRGFFIFEGPDDLSLQEIKQIPFVAFPFSGVLLFPQYLSGYLFFNIGAFFS